jgi:hypothetical protein
MRQDEHTVQACVRDAITIQQLKFLHRQEVANPPAIWIGVLSGGLVAYITSGAKLKELSLSWQYSDVFIRIVLTLSGIFIGFGISYIAKQFMDTQYEWNFMSRDRRILVICLSLSLFLMFTGFSLLK